VCERYPCAIEDPETAPQRRLALARALLAESTVLDAPSPTLGAVTLRPDQVETVRRVRAQLRRDGGCLLADDVGTGKTYVALAAARDWTHALIVVPASLRSTWAQATRRADVRCVFTTHEALSRGRALDGEFDGIVVDESHRFRPTSRRHAALADLAARAPLLMLSATPLQNRARELAAQLALFLGEIAYELEPEELTRWVVRSQASTRLALPRVRPPRWLPVDADDADVLRAILALPPPPRAADVGDGGVLLQLSLVRAWASSRAALIATVQRRQRTLVAVEQCHLEGRLPTKHELRSWTGSADVQLGFPTLLASSRVDEQRRAVLGEAIERERAALAGLLRTIADAPDPDVTRVEALLAARREHDGESILAFSEWRSTVQAYWLALRRASGIGLLCAAEARIASGRLPRDELLARFAPHAQGVRAPVSHERVTLLLATDLLSEGVNLQDASVVVHLDLPWNPARLAQRLGRIRRPGGADDVASYLMSPPAHAALLLQVEARLRAKLARAERTIGRSIGVLPALGATGFAPTHDAGDEARRETQTPPLSAAELRSEIMRRLEGWRSAAERSVARSADSPAGVRSAVATHLGRSVAADHLVAAAHAESSGWIALLGDGRLLAAHGDAEPPGPSESPEAIMRALDLAAGAARPPGGAERDEALRALDAWMAHDWSRHSSGLDVADTPMRRRMRRAIDETVRTAPRHRRPEILRAAATVRDAITRALPLGSERALDALVGEPAASPCWLTSAAAIVARAPVSSTPPAERAPPDWRVLILLGREKSE
jgi:superfamily II DNA or RNA helicase